MSLLPSASPCCESDCAEATSIAVPGPAGATGAAGTNGTDGENGWSETTASFIMPAEGANVTIAVTSSAPFAVGQNVFISVGGAKGTFEVISKPTATSLEVQNLENTASALYLSNSAPTTVFASGALVVPGGLQGPSGDDASGAPTTSQYILQTADAALTSAQALDALTDGAILKTNAGGTGALEAATEGTDYLSGTSGLTKAGNLSGLADAATARSNLGLVIGTNVQAQDATLQSIAALGTAADRYAYTTGVDTWAEDTITAAGRAILDDADAAAQRTTLGLGLAIANHIGIADLKASGTAGGDFTSGAWQTRTLSTMAPNTGSYCSLSSNRFTLQPGKYWLYAVAPAYKVDNHQIRIYNVTDGLVSLGGVNARSGATDDSVTMSEVSHYISIATAKEYELQHRCETTRATDGMGPANSFGGNETYAQVIIYRLAND